MYLTHRTVQLFGFFSFPFLTNKRFCFFFSISTCFTSLLSERFLSLRKMTVNSEKYHSSLAFSTDSILRFAVFFLSFVNDRDLTKQKKKERKMMEIGTNLGEMN